jgi:glutaredoxin
VSIKAINDRMSSFLKLALSMDTGYSLFPNIYFGKEHIGGYDDFIFYFSI